MSNKSILFWDSSVSDMKSGRKFGGIAVQLNFWMQVFRENGWEIHSLTENNSYMSDSVEYHHISHIKTLEFALEWTYIYWIVKRVHPQIIVFRGARRLLYPLQKIAHHFGSKVIMFGASDVNFVLGKASVGNRINRLMYESAVRKMDYIVCQNEYQVSSLKKNFRREALMIPNIWGQMSMDIKSDIPCADVVWVGNFRRLKRPEWFYEMARSLPNSKFAIAGGPADLEYYNRMKNKAATIANLDFLGQLSIEESNVLISKAKILVCSSEYEGFPNTFLQAWSAEIPVVSTVDPNGLINTNNLGISVDTPQSLINAIHKLLNNAQLYQSMQLSISNYFLAHHSPQRSYDELISYIASK